MNITITPPLRKLDHEFAARRDELARRDAAFYGSRVLMEYIGGALVTMGYYSNSDDAKRQAPEVGRWHELGSGTDNWRSDDGRVLVLSSYKWAPGAP